jgi:hypothetical protein
MSNLPITFSTKTVHELKEMAVDITQTIAYQKEILDAINEEILGRYQSAFMAELKVAGKTDGEMTREFDGVRMTFAIKPKVKWDSKKLQAVAATMPWEKIEKVFKIEFSVPERTYKSITEDALMAAIVPARTVEYSAPKIVFTAE